VMAAGCEHDARAAVGENRAHAFINAVRSRQTRRYHNRARIEASAKRGYELELRRIRKRYRLTGKPPPLEMRSDRSRPPIEFAERQRLLDRSLFVEKSQESSVRLFNRMPAQADRNQIHACDGIRGCSRFHESTLSLVTEPFISEWVTRRRTEVPINRASQRQHLNRGGQVSRSSASLTEGANLNTNKSTPEHPFATNLIATRMSSWRVTGAGGLPMTGCGTPPCTIGGVARAAPAESGSS